MYGDSVDCEEAAGIVEACIAAGQVDRAPGYLRECWTLAMATGDLAARAASRPAPSNNAVTHGDRINAHSLEEASAARFAAQSRRYD
jgi:hypothetical protein